MYWKPDRIPAYIVKQMIRLYELRILTVAYYLSYPYPGWQAAVVRSLIIQKTAHNKGYPNQVWSLSDEYLTAHGKMELIRRNEEIKDHERELRNRRTRAKSPIHPK